MGIRIDGASALINATDGSLTIEGQSINSTGIGTFSGGVKVGTAATIHSTGQFNIGVAATIFANGNATFAGILTAASYSAVSGTTGTFSGNVNTGPVLTVTGTEGVSANLYLIADDGDDNGDGWRINSNQDDNDLTISNNTTGSYVDKFTLLKTGELTLTSDLTIPDKIIHSGDTNTAIRFPDADTFTVETAGAEALRIKSNGFVGIRTDNPYSALSIKTTAEPALTGNLADHGILLHSPGATKNDVISISASFINNAHQPRCAMGFISHPTADPIEGYAGEIGFYTRDAADGSAVQPGDEKVRINRVGRVGIGTTSPSNLLHTYKSTSDGIQFQSPSGQHYIYAIESNDNLANGTLAGELGIRGKNGVAISGNNGTSCQVHINSNGLCLGGTGAANGLDDYETGTFSMTVNLINESYVAQTFYYVKIGSLVTWSGRLEWSGGSGTSDQILGLPFTVKNQDYTNNMTTNIYSNSGLDVGTADYLCAYHAQGNTRLNMTKQTTTAQYNLPGAANIYMTCFYYTDS